MVDRQTVQEVATRLGIDVDEEAAAGYAEAAADLAAQFEALETQEPDHDPAASVRAGDDEYNAVRHRFELGATDGSLADLEVGVKDNIAVAGVPVHCGSAAVEFTPSYHATVVERLQAAGAAVTATTNMDEFAYFTTGETCAFEPIQNPRDPDAVPGGSSSGSGAGVAAGVFDAALGSDTGGSIRIPAAFCGVVGLKPTHRSVPRYGFADLAPSLDCVGPLGPDVETVARVFEAIAGPDPNDPSSLVSPEPSAVTDGLDDPVESREVGVVQPAMAGADDEVRAAVEGATDLLTDRGVATEPVELPRYQLATVAGLAVAGAEFAALAGTDGQVVGTGTGYSEAWSEAFQAAVRSPDLGQNVRDQLLTSGALSAEGLSHYIGAQNTGSAFTAAVDERLVEYDALVLPTTPMTPPGFGEVTTDEDFARTVANTAPFNLTGHPALSVPAPNSTAPVGVQFVGDRHDERTLFTLGAALERTR